MADNLSLNPTGKNNVTDWKNATRVTGVTVASTGRTTCGECEFDTGAWTGHIAAGHAAGSAATTGGKTLTYVMWVHSSVARRIRAHFSYYSGNTYGGTFGSSDVTLAADTWTKVRRTAVCPDDGVFNRVGPHVDFPTSGDAGILRVGAVRIVEGDVPDLEFADGDTSGWVWDGTAGNSTSHGVTGDPEPDPDPDPGDSEQPTHPDPDEGTQPPTTSPPVIVERVTVPTFADWSFAIGPPGLITRELNAATSRKVSFKLKDSSDASVVIDGHDPAAREIVELSTDLYVFRRRAPGQPRELMYRGRISKASDSLSDSGHTVTLPSIDYRGVLKRRLLMSGFTTIPASNSTYVTGDSPGQRWTQIDQMVIAWDLIDGVQRLTNGDLGIVNGAGQSSGIKRDRTYQMGDPIGDKIEELSEVIDGFDWDITPTYDAAGGLGLKLDRWYPSRGIVRNEVLTYLPEGSNLASVERQVDSSDFANSIRLTGRAPEQQEGSTVTPVAPPPVQRPLPSAEWVAGPEGRWDRMSAEDITTLKGLEERADWTLANSNVVLPSYTATLKPGVWRGPDHFWLGDTVKLVIQSGRLNVETDLRVQQIDIDLDDKGSETVSVSLGSSRKDLKSKLVGIDRRLNRLERR